MKFKVIPSIIACAIWLSVGMPDIPTGPTVSVKVSGNPNIVDVRVWPESVTLQPAELAQFYAAALERDGRVLCSDATPNLVPAPWTNTVECEAAAALLDYSLAQAPFVRVTYTPLDAVEAARFDSLFYVTQVALTATDSVVHSARLPHPDSVVNFDTGQPNVAYYVQVSGEGYAMGTLRQGPPSPAVPFTYPDTLPLPGVVTNVRVDSIYPP